MAKKNFYDQKMVDRVKSAAEQIIDGVPSQQAKTKVISPTDISNRYQRVISPTDKHISLTDISNRYHIDVDILTRYINQMVNIDDIYITKLLRITASEDEVYDKFINRELRDLKLKGKYVSLNRLFRYALWYLLKEHKKEFITALQKALKKEEKLT